MASAATISRSFPLDGSMDECVGTVDQGFRCGFIAQVAGQPLYRLCNILEASSVAVRTIPTAKPMARVSQVTDHVAAKKSGCSCDGNVHEYSRPLSNLLSPRRHSNAPFYVERAKPVPSTKRRARSIAMITIVRPSWLSIPRAALTEPCLETDSGYR